MEKRSLIGLIGLLVAFGKFPPAFLAAEKKLPAGAALLQGLAPGDISAADRILDQYIIDGRPPLLLLLPLGQALFTPGHIKTV